MRQVHARGVARFRIVVKREALTNNEFLTALDEFADPQLRALKVGENADRPAELAFHGPDAADQSLHRRMVGVAHIDAEYIGAGFEKLPDHPLVRRGGTESCDNLDLAVASH